MQHLLIADMRVWQCLLQGAVATVLGFFLLGGVEFHTLNVMGIFINTLGGTW
jgi:solute carrier family 35 protein